MSGAANSLASTDRLTYFKDGLRESGLLEGRDYSLETRFAAGNYARFPELARELAQAGVSIIVTNTIASVRAAQALTPPLAIVMSAINDPVSAGLVASLTRPGGTTTGIATLGEDLTPKLLDFQRTVVPKATVLATLFNPANPSNPKFVDEITTRAGAIGITVVPVALPSPDALDAAFATIATHHPDALAIIADAGTFDVMDRIAAAALAQRLPSFTVSPIYAKYGGLLGYGPAPQALWGRATPVTEQAEIEHAFANIGNDGGMIVNPDPFMNGNIALVIDLAARHRVPAIYGTAGDLAKFGALMVYNLDLLDHYRQGGKYVERILNGENPADLPVQQPTRFQFAINLKTAKALGLTVPQPLLIGADEVIE